MTEEPRLARQPDSGTEQPQTGAPPESAAEPTTGPTLEAEGVDTPQSSAVEELSPATTKKKGKKKRDYGELGTSRGIETMFRTSYRTHIDLSSLADNKANIMISINGIIISILIASIAPGLGDSLWLMIPTSVLLLGCLTSMVFAVLAARPRITHSNITLDDAKSGRANILFFGNFVALSQDDFVEGMQALMKDTDQVYVNMSRDIHSLGTVLERKFRLLRLSYTAFMFGLVAGVLLLLASYPFMGLGGISGGL